MVYWMQVPERLSTRMLGSEFVEPILNLVVQTCFITNRSGGQGGRSALVAVIVEQRPSTVKTSPRRLSRTVWRVLCIGQVHRYLTGRQKGGAPARPE
jgi:hypothetical protein